ncbi:YybH family protein [Phenylobacterium montanum]|uniref:DUF4440 domain-containing protein n=1 Tax=Phenylobacterium montanum TaxID=2823693 RepID=A0A975IUG3_9CAUL|nr:DUF4440 domain-containing protein [Caulobacter sp. S6]QUD87720.1 DUF4440 domain-containing protein [Caulobacter sp. S6]
MPTAAPYARAAALILIAGLGACSKTPTVDVAKEVAALQAEDAAINAAYKARDAVKATAYDAADYLSYTSGAPTVKGRDADLAGTKDSFTDPGFGFSFTADRTEVAKSGDLAYQAGSYTQTQTNPATKKVETVTGNWVAAWRKEPDGAWRIASEAVTQAPAPAAKP